MARMELKMNHVHISNNQFADNTWNLEVQQYFLSSAFYSISLNNFSIQSRKATWAT